MSALLDESGDRLLDESGATLFDEAGSEVVSYTITLTIEE